MAQSSEVIYVPSGAGEGFLVVGDLNTVKLSGKDTGDAYAVWINAVAPGNGPPPHVHHREHEDFFILEGVFEIYREGQPPLRVGPGDFVHTPKGVTHTYRNIGTAVGRLLGLAVPAGIERFFAEVGQPAPGMTEPPPTLAAPTPEQVDYLLQAARKYGIEIKPLS
jgi:mannose-6-phosphate isomerase-like protein (cupin superfamily)